MTRDATVLWPRGAGHVLRVIEFQIEALLEPFGEWLARRIDAVHVLMTDRTHRNARRGELRQVTTGAIPVTGETRPRGIVVAVVTIRTEERRVFRAGVQKFRVVHIISLCRH